MTTSAGSERGSGDTDVPVIGGSDEDGIDGLVVEHLAEVHVGGRRGRIGAGLYLLAPGSVDVAHGNDLKGSTTSVSRGEQLAHAAACANP